MIHELQPGAHTKFPTRVSFRSTTTLIQRTTGPLPGLVRCCYRSEVSQVSDEESGAPTQHREERHIRQSHTSPRMLVALLAAAVFLVRSAALMLGPLLVALAFAFAHLGRRGRAAGCGHQCVLGDHRTLRGAGLRHLRPAARGVDWAVGHGGGHPRLRACLELLGVAGVPPVDRYRRRHDPAQ